MSFNHLLSVEVSNQRVFDMSGGQNLVEICY